MRARSAEIEPRSAEIELEESLFGGAPGLFLHVDFFGEEGGPRGEEGGPRGEELDYGQGNDDAMAVDGESDEVSDEAVVVGEAAA